MKPVDITIHFRSDTPSGSGGGTSGGRLLELHETWFMYELWDKIYCVSFSSIVQLTWPVEKTKTDGTAL